MLISSKPNTKKWEKRELNRWQMSYSELELNASKNRWFPVEPKISVSTYQTGKDFSIWR